MIACYDLARCPPTYDAVAFLALAELERLRRQEPRLDIFILPGPADGFRRDSLWPYTVEERIHLRDNVLIPLCRLLPSASSVGTGDTRWLTQMGKEHWGYNEYHIGLPVIVSALKQGSRPLRAQFPSPVFPGPKLVTFTLREAEHYPLRNSHTPEWVAAADILVRKGLDVCFVRDTAWASKHITGHNNAQYAPHRIDDRARLYSRAALNVGISNGPMWMSIFMDAPTLMLRPTTNEAGGCYDDTFYSRYGIRRGDQLPTSPPHQRLVWEEDTCENIVRAVEDMLG